ncbi:MULTISPECIES: hypothetical protein [Cyanophyceae]|uniref:hypothetical protein n=1 Tax=Cyanophyceae TaxID=3028117 RepID=UPI001686E277|nr:hypothetical protein [Trichocoleus sp. FACHB-40]MBD2005601.1 hypothetical protein [Trichocoleus sp. FACHB-40]
MALQNTINRSLVAGTKTALGGDAPGDLYYRDPSGLLTRLPIGTPGQLLSVSGSNFPSWTAAPSTHTQNTDTGTTSSFFQIDSGNVGPRLKNSAGGLQIRNAGDTAFANLEALDLIINGNLVVNGTTTTINSATLTVDDINIVLGDVAPPTDATANGGGITLKGATDKTIVWDSSNTNWTCSEHWNLLSGKSYKINNVNVLTATGLGSTVVSSSLTSVGTITTGTWNGTNIAVGNGGTGRNTGGTAYGLIAAGTSATGTQQTVPTGTASQVLIGGGASALPSWGSLNLASMVTGKLPLANVANGTALQQIRTNSSANALEFFTPDPFGMPLVAASASLTAAINTRYVCDGATLVTLTLPATAPAGSVIQVIGRGAGGWRIAQPAGITIFAGDVSTTAGTPGSANSTHQRDCLTLTCIIANTEWVAEINQGNVDFI